ncbi:hypothetical protein HHL21_03720 [Massilia sp. RP-1-19]|uniref:DUF4148 domain-containing protein n=1 Tax=Massilia polaris TaxID=2728846 RepID=A0A848HNU6_9BURK|nr:hypothetical protein [Massilia polaris]NML60208.1 hypothetical protein [Massilia polaris]
MKTLIRFALVTGCALSPVAALAQDQPGLAPMNPTAAAAPLVYESAFADYRADTDTPPVGWKDSNERVAQPRDEHAGHDMGASPEKKHPHHGHQHKE